MHRRWTHSDVIGDDAVEGAGATRSRRDPRMIPMALGDISRSARWLRTCTHISYHTTHKGADRRTEGGTGGTHSHRQAEGGTGGGADRRPAQATPAQDVGICHRRQQKHALHER